MARIVCSTFKRTGWVLAVALFLAAPAWADTSFDWRTTATGDYVTPVENQGSAGACWAFAVVGAVESKLEISAHNPNLDIILSEQNLICAGTDPKSPGYGIGSSSGGLINGALFYVRDYGITTAAKLPYTATDSASPPSSWPLSGSYTLYGVKGVQYVPLYPDKVADSVAIINSDLERYGPLVANIYADGSGSGLDDLQDSTAGLLTTQTNYSDKVDHSVDIVGFQDDASVAGGGYYIVKNSWGTGWGDQGFGYVSYAAMVYDDEVMDITGTPWETQIFAVPEPISMIFFATGLMGVVGCVARRRMQTR